jgi:tetratricopeptide (TPR) repeat protein
MRPDASSRRRALGACLLILLALIAYLPALRDGWVWDDDAHVVDNVQLRTLRGLFRIWFVLRAVPQYYPLTHTVFWLEYHLWGPSPAGFHLMSVLGHAATAALAWLVLEALAVPGAFFAAAVFAAHPIQAESVVWVTELKNVLAALFTLASARAYLLWSGREDSARGLYAASLALFFAALLSKTVACSLPAVLLLVLWWKRGKVAARDLRGLAPMFAAGLGFGLLTAWIEKTGVGARGSEWAFSPAERVLIAGRALWFYAGKLLWPASLAFVYPRWRLDASDPVQWLWPAAAVGTLVALWLLRGRLGRGPLVGALCFAGTLFPALGFIDVYPMRYTFVADHYQYMAGLALIALGAGAVSTALARLGPRAARAGPALAAPVLVILAGLSWARARVYVDSETLWRDTLARNPDSWMARCNMAKALVAHGKMEEAVSWLQKALELSPASEEAHNNLGTTYAAMGRMENSVAEYRKALASRPGYAEAHGNLGTTLARLGRHDEAVAEFETALRLRPGSNPARVNLAIAYAEGKRWEEAAALLEQAVASDPEDPGARMELGDVYMSMGRLAKAEVQFAEAVRAEPEVPEGHYNLGNAYYVQRRFEQAVGQYAEAVRLKPDFAQALINRGNALARMRRLGEALECYQKALVLQPENVRIRLNMAEVFRAMGRFDAAADQYAAVLRSDPRSAEARRGLEALGRSPAAGP